MAGKNRTILLKDKQEKKSKGKKGKMSMYARKHAYLAKAGLWGFDVPSPKPWGTKN